VNRAQEALVMRDWVGDVGKKVAGMAGRGIYLRGTLRRDTVTVCGALVTFDQLLNLNYKPCSPPNCSHLSPPPGCFFLLSCLQLPDERIISESH
jgi:hypothetical protein